MKNYKDLYEEEKQRHEQALQKYQEYHMDEIEIINLHKMCNEKARKVSQPKKVSGSPKSDEPKKSSGSSKSDEPKKASGSSKSDEPKKVSRSPGLIDDPSEEGQKPKKASSDGKKTATKAGKKVKNTSQPKKTRKSLEFIDSGEEEEKGLPKDNKGKNTSFAGCERRSPKFF